MCFRQKAGNVIAQKFEHSDDHGAADLQLGPGPGSLPMKQLVSKDTVGDAGGQVTQGCSRAVGLRLFLSDDPSTSSGSV